MKKTQANEIIGLISEFPPDEVMVSQGMQTAMNNFIDSYLKENPKTSSSTMIWDFDKRAKCFTKSFKQAMRVKLKEIHTESTQKSVPVTPDEKEYLIKEASEVLEGKSVQHINQLIKKYNLPVRVESPRKRYITESTIKKIRTGNY